MNPDVYPPVPIRKRQLLKGQDRVLFECGPLEEDKRVPWATFIARCEAVDLRTSKDAERELMPPEFYDLMALWPNRTSTQAT
jgi:hypothetical protein